MRWWIRSKTASGFEDVLARCLAAIEAGEATVESCLSEHPAHAERLGPALRTALGVRQRLAVRPDPAFVLRARQRLLEAAATQRRPLTVVTPVEQPVRRHSLRPVFAAAAAVLVLFFVSVPVVAVASANALPGDLLYPIKLGIEETRVVLALSDEARVERELARAEARAEEILELAERGRVGQIPRAAKAYQQQLEQARKPLSEKLPPDLATKIEQSVARQEDTIRVAVERLQGSTAMTKVEPTATATPTPSATTEAATAEASASAVPSAEPSPGATPTATAQVATPSPTSSRAGTSSRTPSPAPAATPTPSPQQAQAAQAARDALALATDTRAQAASAAAVRASQTATPTPTPTPVRTSTPTSTPVPPLTPSTAQGTTGTPAQTPTPVPTATATPVPPLTPVDTQAGNGTASPRTTDTATATATPVTPRPATATPLPALTPGTATQRPATSTPATSTPAGTAAETPRAGATPAPTATETAAPAETPRPTATAAGPTSTPATPGVRVGQATPTPTATVTPTTPLSRPVTLPAGRSVFLYLGLSLPVDEALAPFVGKYTWIEWKPATSPLVMQYRPGVSTNRPILTTGSLVVIELSEPVTVGPNTLVQIEQ